MGILGQTLRLVIGSALVLGSAGCGYRVVRYAGLPDDSHRVAIETLENDSSEPGVEQLVADSLRREILARGGMILVGNPREADVVIRGRIPSIQTLSQSFSSVVLALEYTLTLTLDLRFEGRKGERLGSTGSYRASELYLASADVEAARRNREEALRRVAALLAGRVHDALDREILQ